MLISSFEEFEKIIKPINEIKELFIEQYDKYKIQISIELNNKDLDITLKLPFGEKSLEHLQDVSFKLMDLFNTKIIHEVIICQYCCLLDNLVDTINGMSYLRVNAEVPNSFLESVVCSNVINLHLEEITNENIDLLSCIFQKEQLKEINIPHMDTEILIKFLDVLKNNTSINTINFYSKNMFDRIIDNIDGDYIYLNIQVDNLILVMNCLTHMPNVIHFKVCDNFWRRTSLAVLFNSISKTSVKTLDCSKIQTNMGDQIFNTSLDGIENLIDKDRITDLRLITNADNYKIKNMKSYKRLIKRKKVKLIL